MIAPARGALGLGSGGFRLLAQVAEQFVHIPQVIQGPVEGGFLVHARAGHFQEAAVQVVGQLLDQLVLGLGPGGRRSGGRPRPGSVSA